jgi:hypothetical protein
MNIQFTWPDRRPIGKLNIGANPPNRWIWDVYPDIYRGASLIDKARAYFDRSLVQLKQLDAQAVAFWDCEGMKYPQPISYIGSPDKAQRMNPDFPYDEFFGWYTDAGYKLGFTIRPTEFNLKTHRQVESPDPIATMIRKCKYAMAQWGASIFYIDSNVWPDPWLVYPGMIFAWLQKALGDVLIIPEHKGPWVHLWTAGWREFNDLPVSETGTPPDILAEIPDAFSVLNVSIGQIPAHAVELKASFDRGDIPLIDAWGPSKQLDDLLGVLN